MTTSAVIVADSSWHSTRNLLATWPPTSDSAALLHRFEPIDWRNAYARRIPPWRWGIRSRNLSPQITLTTAELPPGWMKSFPYFGQWPLARSARKWRDRLSQLPDRTSLWITYPYYLALAEMLKPDRLIYYNLDDYTLYWPTKAEDVRKCEADAVARSDWTICVAAERARQLRENFPDRADRILHIPHGAPEATIPESPYLEPGTSPPELAGIPRPILGYLGGLEDRMDWVLVNEIAEKFPNASIVLVGPKPNTDDADRWRTEARKAIASPNVYAVGSVAQERIPEFYATFDINLIPYDVSHPFNIVSSPTKLMDSMGCGRPTVATALPECQVHRERIIVASDHDEFLTAIERLIRQGCRDGREELRHRYAWENRAAVILDMLYRLA